LTRPRAAIVVTGSELVRGDRSDLNGPFYAREALSLGLVPDRITIVGDGRAELLAALEGGLDADVLLVSGGLGPTHDDRTIELVAEATGRRLVVDPELEREIEQVSRTVAERLRRPYADFAHGVTKQATLPEGAINLGLAGTAPGVVVVLPGPPGELQRLWPRAVASAPFRRVLLRTETPLRQVLRFYGASESAVAQALTEAGGDGDGVEVTICARDFEIHVDLIVEPGAEERAAAIARDLQQPLREYLFAVQEESVQEIVVGMCRARGLRLATAESCTGGLVAARLTEVPGASDVFCGGIVAYANDVKLQQLGVPPQLLEAHGAVSAEAAAAMATGVRERLGADVAVAVTGVAGPGGGTPEKPVGLVFVHAVAPGGEQALRFEFPGQRDWIRARSTVAALHLVRRLLTQSPHEAV
jgi:nicotinamide-nucleotide amidase